MFELIWLIYSLNQLIRSIYFADLIINKRGSLARLLHNFLFLCWVALLHNFLKELERDPSDQRANGHLEAEGPIYVTHLEVLPEKRNRANVD